MVKKNKALPDSSRLSAPRLHSLSLFLSLSLADLALSRLVSRVFSLADAIHPEGNPWILPRLDPGTPEKGLATHSSILAWRIP